MSDTVQRALFYFAVLAGILILVAYYAGTVQVGKVGFSGLNQLFLTAQARNPNGTFSPYPGNAPASGSGG